MRHILDVRTTTERVIMRIVSRVRTRAAAVVAALLCAASLTFSAETTAYAATDYKINMNKACAHFTNVGWSYAKTLDQGNPYSIRCSTAPWPMYVQWQGDIDFNAWCAYWHGNGAYSVVLNQNSASSWRCRVP